MGVLINGSLDVLSIAEGPLSTKFCMTFWARLLADQDYYAGPTGFIAGEDYFLPGATGSDGIDARIAWNSPSASDTLSGTMNSGNLYTIDQWEFFFASCNGTAIVCKALSTGESTFQDSTSDTLGDDYLTWEEFFIGVDDWGGWQNCEVASVKIWSNVILSDADAQSERLYYNAQNESGSIWAVYKLANGALTTDSSGNGKTLSSAGTPTFASDPSDILGDDPAGGSVPTIIQQMC